MALTIIKCMDITGWQVRVTWYENFRAREELANSFNMTSKVYWFTKKILYQRADTKKIQGVVWCSFGRKAFSESFSKELIQG